ncbi:MAG: tRNA lysidine(34) synthetase TilS [Gammaproteobacteria bacterium]|nr:tRNA lysidine(34) synthetase TilS [Gammaproteobacteria bacterium]MBU1980328.1 tRNA lysidine(34) synthetase TilS [Gammaproteobacteria bacterium]
MASSKKLLPSDLPAFVEAKLKSWVQPGRYLTLALSGGADSVALLDILAQLRTSLNFSLSAIHVNHQISPNSADWTEFCARLCVGYNIPLQVVKVDLKRQPGESLEALARDARYQAFAEQQADFVVLAQHLDDQAETLLLQLLRGAGAKGLSAMGEMREGLEVRGEGGVKTPRYLRPLLDVPRRLILDYAALHKLQWVEDESNADISYDRNYLRHRVMPELEKRFPGYRVTFSRASRNLAESAQLADDLARLDAAIAVINGNLRVDALHRLSGARARNLLRYWLAELGISMPSAGRLENLLQQLCSARDDAQIRISLGSAVIRRYRGEVHLEPTATCPRVGGARELPECKKKILAPLPEAALIWSLQDALDLPGSGGRLVFEWTTGQGLSLARLTSAPVTIRLRQGGERLRPDCLRPTRSLKNLLQEAGMPPWQRQRLPLLFSGEKLAFVPGVGIDCDYRVQEGEPGVIVKLERAI